MAVIDIDTIETIIRTVQSACCAAGVFVALLLFLGPLFDAAEARLLARYGSDDDHQL